MNSCRILSHVNSLSLSLGFLWSCSSPSAVNTLVLRSHMWHLSVPMALVWCWASHSCLPRAWVDMSRLGCWSTADKMIIHPSGATIPKLEGFALRVNKQLCASQVHLIFISSVFIAMKLVCCLLLKLVIVLENRRTQGTMIYHPAHSGV